MQGEREQMRGRAEEMRGAVTEIRGRAERLLGRGRASLGGVQTRFRGMPSTGLVGGTIAFALGALAATLMLFPGARVRLWESVERYTGRARPERPIDRIRRWSRRAADSLGLNW